jgi:hypothetical protein
MPGAFAWLAVAACQRRLTPSNWPETLDEELKSIMTFSLSPVAGVTFLPSALPKASRPRDRRTGWPTDLASVACPRTGGKLAGFMVRRHGVRVSR